MTANDNNYSKMINHIIPICQNGHFKIEDYIIKLKWEGETSNEGFSIKKIDNKVQRNFATMLNSYKLINFKDMSFKIHYSIGNDNQLI